MALQNKGLERNDFLEGLGCFDLTLLDLWHVTSKAQSKGGIIKSKSNDPTDFPISRGRFTTPHLGEIDLHVLLISQKNVKFTTSLARQNFEEPEKSHVSVTKFLQHGDYEKNNRNATGIDIKKYYSYPLRRPSKEGSREFPNLKSSNSQRGNQLSSSKDRW